jgi:protocatechuate 3,4-dioxygenase beta subunit
MFRNHSGDTITERAVEAYSQIEDPRLREIVAALMPTPYPVPTDGPVGDLLRVARRHPYRPAHIHFIVSKPGYETLITQVFVDGDPTVATDVVFTASGNMVGKFQRDGDHYCLNYDFQLRPGVSTMPKAPIP